MRLAVLADIHANLPALEAVIADMAAFDVDHVVVAGDSINWGPYPAQVIERIMRDHWAVIRGNHEFYMLEWNQPHEPAYRREWTLPRWLNEAIPDRWRQVIAALPDSLMLHFPGVPPVQVLHASSGDHWRGIYALSTDAEIAAMLAGIEAETVIVGHTHLPMHRQSGHWQIVNPGSVGVPLNGIHGASYLLLDGDASGWTPTFRHVEYDMQPLFAAYERMGFVDAHGATGRLIIEELRAARPMVWGFNQWAQANHPSAPRTLALAESFLADATARWDYLPGAYRLNLPQHVNHR